MDCPILGNFRFSVIFTLFLSSVFLILSDYSYSIYLKCRPVNQEVLTCMFAMPVFNWEKVLQPKLIGWYLISEIWSTPWSRLSPYFSTFLHYLFFGMFCFSSSSSSSSFLHYFLLNVQVMCIVHIYIFIIVEFLPIAICRKCKKLYIGETNKKWVLHVSVGCG